MAVASARATTRTTAVRPGKISSNNTQKGRGRGTYVCVCVCKGCRACPRVNLQHNLLIWFLCQLQRERDASEGTNSESNHRSSSTQPQLHPGNSGKRNATRRGGWQFMKNSLVSHCAGSAVSVANRDDI